MRATGQLTTRPGGGALTLGAALACAAACGPEGADAGDPACVASAAAPIYYGEPDAPSLGLRAAQRAAIGAVELRDGSHQCTATLITARWILTAAHCDMGWPLQFRVGDEIIPVHRWVRHPDEDVMLGWLAAVPRRAAPLSLTERAPKSGWLGRDVVLAGRGLQEDGELGELLFATEPVVEVDERYITVDGQNQRGACVGDSGGPLLAKEQDGTVRVIGTLSEGDPSCLGIDLYLRTDALGPWIETARAEADGDLCGDLTRGGRCAWGAARYCEGGEPVIEQCAAGCDWRADVGGFRCLDPSSRCTPDDE